MSSLGIKSTELHLKDHLHIYQTSIKKLLTTLSRKNSLECSSPKNKKTFHSCANFSFNLRLIFLNGPTFQLHLDSIKTFKILSPLHRIEDSLLNKD